MAKIALIFLFAFCVFQISSAARIPRDAQDEIPKTLENMAQQFAQFIEKAVTKENMEKIVEDLKQFGEQLNTKGKELVEQVDAGVKKLQAE